MTSTLNRDRFSKVLALAESSNDHEALAAIRRATGMARAAGLSLGEAYHHAWDADMLGVRNRFPTEAERRGILLGTVSPEGLPKARYG